MTAQPPPVYADRGFTPVKRVASGTHARELERLALQERAHPHAMPLAIQTVIWIFRAYNAAVNEFAASLRSLDLSPSAFNVLQALANTPGQQLEPCELAERLLVSRPSVTGLLDTLEAKSLVARHRHPEDRRRVLVALTEEGRELLQEHYPDHYAFLRRMAGELSEDEMDTLVTLLRKVHGAMPPDLAASEAPVTPAPDAPQG